MKALFVKDMGSLRSADDQAAEMLRGIKRGEIVMVEVKRPRNLEMHRLFWALMQKVAENQTHYRDAEEVCAAFKIATGHCTYVKTKHGLVGLPKSISFASMDQDSFRAFFDKAVDFMVSDVLPGVDRKDLTREVEDMLGGAHPGTAKVGDANGWSASPAAERGT